MKRKEIPNRAVVSTQWGDEGKGKIVDVFAEEADIIARGTGGANAGHTIRIGEREFIFHLVPAGIIRPKKVNIIGNGVVLDPRVLCEELDILRHAGIEYESRLLLALNAKLVLPQHLLLDRVSDSSAKSGKIGTTGRGIGPAYADHYSRIGLTINDLLNPHLLEEKLERNLREKRLLLRECDPEVIKKIMWHSHLGSGQFYSENDFLDVQAITKAYLAYGRRLAPLICDTDNYLRAAVGHRPILLEGAQGTLLSVDYGTYPFVTSSDCGIEGLVKGVGLRTPDIQEVWGIAKAPYMTRVGEGPFPTEMGGERSAHWCGNGATCKTEREQYSQVSFESENELEFGIAVRFAGKEYGATTGRPRRTGWVDTLLLKLATTVNGPDVILTKLDVLSGCKTIKICTAYQYDGPQVRWGMDTLYKGETLRKAIPNSEVLEHCKPIYELFPGWKQDITGIRRWRELPPELKHIIHAIEEKAGVNARILSVGPDRSQMIFR